MPVWGSDTLGYDSNRQLIYNLCEKNLTLNIWFVATTAPHLKTHMILIFFGQKVKAQEFL